MSVDKSQQVSLGCGTLILIALIVMIFSSRGTNDVEDEIRGLRTEIGELKLLIEAQSDEIDRLQDQLEEAARRE